MKNIAYQIRLCDTVLSLLVQPYLDYADIDVVTENKRILRNTVNE